MRRTKKRKRLTPGVAAASGPFDVGGVPLGPLAHPFGSKRRARGRLGRKLKAGVKKTPAPVSTEPPSPKALARWEGEGGSPPPRTTKSDRAKKAGAAPAAKKSAATHSPKKERPKPGASRVKDRR
jgi:hypothetical protein